jgi:methylenetetrahydrofolate dehydrogenase (NADP+)/methenyltetrahydrofolate cyclohydrolase
MPAAFLLVQENATVTVCHSRTRDLARHVKDAEIIVVAAGKPGLITGEMVRTGVVVVDVGINVVAGTIVGDVDFESVRQRAAAITPVPGGVGPLTNALLLAHLVRAAKGQEAASDGDPRGPAVAAAATGDATDPVPPRAPTSPGPAAAGTVPAQPVTTARGAP